MANWAEILRDTFSKSDAARDTGLSTPENIVRCDGILYGKDETWQVLDVYRRKEDEGKTLPVIVSVHGGGWVYGDKDGYQYYCMELARHGFAVVNFSYRLAPEDKYPAQMEDINLVFGWVLARAGEYGFDTENIFAAGDSAGAHLLALYAAACTNPACAGEFAFSLPEGLILKAVALCCGEYDFIYTDGTRDMMEGLMEAFLPGGGTEEELDRIRPVNFVTGDFPPTFLMSASEDFLKEEAPVMAAKLTECQVPFTYKFYGSKTHPLAHVFHLDVNSEDAKACRDEECAFFRSFT